MLLERDRQLRLKLTMTFHLLQQKAKEDFRMIRKVLTDSIWQQLSAIMKTKSCYNSSNQS